jgi:hypothetical protein
VDLKSDLGIQGRKSEALFKVVFKTARKHRLNFEAVPYRFNGANTITRTFSFGGVTFPPHLDPSTSLVVVPIDLLQVRSQIDIDYYFGSYQYDVVSNTRGHAGIVAGVAYFHTKGVLQTPPILTQLYSIVISPVATEERSVPLPLIGGEFRCCLIPTRKLLNINGEVNGMSLGSEGKYVQGNLNAGVAVLPIIRLQAVSTSSMRTFITAATHEASNCGSPARFSPCKSITNQFSFLIRMVCLYFSNDGISKAGSYGCQSERHWPGYHDVWRTKY